MELAERKGNFCLRLRFTCTPLGWEAESMHGTDGASRDAPSVGKGSVAPVVLGQALPGLLGADHTYRAALMYIQRVGDDC